MSELLRMVIPVLQFITQAVLWFVCVCFAIDIYRYFKYSSGVNNMKGNKRRHFGLGSMKNEQAMREAEQEARRAMEVATNQIQTIMDLCLEYEKVHGSDVRQWDVFTLSGFAARVGELDTPSTK